MGKEPPADAKDVADQADNDAPYDPALNIARLGFDPLSAADT
jgi:hypothetical protein